MPLWDIYAGVKSSLDNKYGFARERDLFLQTTWGLKHKIFKVGFTARYINTALHDPLYLDLFEPALTTKIGYKWVKLILYGGGSFLLNKAPVDYEEKYIFSPLYLSLGLQFDVVPSDFKKKDQVARKSF